MPGPAMTGTGVGARLVVTRDTTAAQLEQFGKEVGADARLRGKANDDGSVTLWARDHDSGRMSRLFGRHERREAAVMTALRQVNRNVADANAALGGSAEGPLDALLGRADLSLRGTAAETVGRALALTVGTPAPKGPDSPALDTLAAAGTIRQALARAATEHLSGADGQGAGIAKALLAKAVRMLPAADRDTLALSPARGLKAEVESALRGSAGTLSPQEAKALTALASEIVEHAVGGLAEGRMTAPDEVDIGGRTYRQTSVLGQGGFGRALLFREVGGHDEIVLKVPVGDDLMLADRNAEALRDEIPRHRAVARGGDPNVLAFRGAVRLADGTVGIAMEKAASTDLFALQGRLADAVRDGHLSRQVADRVILTLLRDVNGGLRHVHAQGMAHLDLKPQNVFLRTDGTAMLADFGTSTGDAGLGEAVVAVDTPLYKSPESILYGREEMAAARGREHVRDGATVALGQALFPGGLDKDQKDLLATLGGRIDSAQGRHHARDHAAPLTGVGYDQWALGVTALNLATGTTVGEAIGWESQIENALTGFASRGGDAVLVGRDNAGLFAGMGETPLRGLVNGLLRADPDDRLDHDAVDAHVAFRTPGVGSPEARAVIVALMQGADGTTLARLARDLVQVGRGRTGDASGRG